MHAWSCWAVLGLVLFIGEMLLPAFFLLSFGISAMGVATFMSVVPELPLRFQILTFVLLSGVLLFLIRHRLHRSPGSRAGQSDGGYLGAVGRIEAEVGPWFSGRIRFPIPVLAAEVWECVSDEAMPEGSTARVTGIRGNILVVVRADHPADPDN